MSLPFIRPREFVSHVDDQKITLVMTWFLKRGIL